MSTLAEIVGSDTWSTGGESPRQDWRPRSLAEWGEEFKYRAAIIEYQGGVSRAEAEALALKIVGPYSREMDRANKNNPRSKP